MGFSDILWPCRWQMKLYQRFSGQSHGRFWFCHPHKEKLRELESRSRRHDLMLVICFQWRESSIWDWVTWLAIPGFILRLEKEWGQSGGLEDVPLRHLPEVNCWDCPSVHHAQDCSTKEQETELLSGRSEKEVRFDERVATFDENV